MNNEFIKLNSLSNYHHIADCYVIEDKSYMPKILNVDTGEEIHWQKINTFERVAYVVKKDGKNTSISHNVINEEYDLRHPNDFF